MTAKNTHSPINKLSVLLSGVSCIALLTSCTAIGNLFGLDMGNSRPKQVVDGSKHPPILNPPLNTLPMSAPMVTTVQTTQSQTTQTTQAQPVVAPKSAPREMDPYDYYDNTGNETQPAPQPVITSERGKFLDNNTSNLSQPALAEKPSSGAPTTTGGEARKPIAANPYAMMGTAPKPAPADMTPDPSVAGGTSGPLIAVTPTNQTPLPAEEPMEAPIAPIAPLAPLTANGSPNAATPPLSSVPKVPPLFKIIRAEQPQNMQDLQNSKRIADEQKQQLDNEPTDLGIANTPAASSNIVPATASAGSSDIVPATALPSSMPVPVPTVAPEPMPVMPSSPATAVSPAVSSVAPTSYAPSAPPAAQPYVSSKQGLSAAVPETAYPTGKAMPITGADPVSSSDFVTTSGQTD